MRRKWIFFALILLTFNGCGGSEVLRPKVSKKPLENYPPCVAKLPAAIDRFQTENVSFDWWNENLAINSREVAVDELVNSGCYSVMERNETVILPSSVMNEKKLARSPEGKSNSPVALPGQVKIAEHLLTFSITGFTKNKEGFDFGLFTAIAGALIGGDKGKTVSAFGGKIRNSSMNMACKLIHTPSSEILASAQVKVKASSFGITVDTDMINNNGFGVGEVSYFKQSKIGKMMADVVHKCAVQLTQNYYRVHGAPTVIESAP